MKTAVKRLLRRTYPLYRPLVSSLGLIDVMAGRHMTDKRAQGYLKHYQRHFKPLRHSTRKVLEIGVGVDYYDSQSGGGSLRMWKDYFPKAEIFGLDIVDRSHLQEPRIRIFRGDQNDPSFLDDLASRWGPFDIIIDDGSHVSEHIITSFTALFPHLTANGVYAIEDLYLSYAEALGGSAVEFDNPRTALGMLKTLIDDMHYRYIGQVGRIPQHYGDQITGVAFYPKICFIQKGDNTRDPYIRSSLTATTLRRASASTTQGCGS
jgi:demethylmacrocin O-methyltransferase